MKANVVVFDSRIKLDRNRLDRRRGRRGRWAEPSCKVIMPLDGRSTGSGDPRIPCGLVRLIVASLPTPEGEANERFSSDEVMAKQRISRVISPLSPLAVLLPPVELKTSALTP